MKYIIYRIVNGLIVSEDNTLRTEAETHAELAKLRAARGTELYTAVASI